MCRFPGSKDACAITIRLRRWNVLHVGRISKAVIKRPTIYVFDEATSSLDTRTERDHANLRDISFHSTTLVIAHRLSTVVYADHFVVLDAGVVVEQGTHEALPEQNGRYAALWSEQQQARNVVEFKGPRP